MIATSHDAGSAAATARASIAERRLDARLARSRVAWFGHPVPRVYLAMPRPADSTEFVALVRASRALHEGWVSPADTPARYRRYVGRCENDDFEGMLVRRAEDDALVGVFNLSQIFYGPLCSAYLGFWAGTPFAGEGYMSAAFPLVLRRAFVKLRLHRVEANVQPSNRVSLRLARRQGFRREGFSPRYLKIAGRWRDHVRLALTVEDWRAR
jgi:ribosomal-protein-alanine N-acetyltransferase